ncbi:MAG: selenocysteine-specific translation elongation factor [Acidimicrobiales bacterium]
MRVVATAGHVDHGKSTLVRALTGTDPDRLAEEKARGLTIDLGFAATTLPSGAEVGFIDVPGHARFIANMLAGVGAVDACLLVVAATEGWKPQSEEHLRILELLGIEHGVIALTKVDLVDSDRRDLAELEVSMRVAGTFLADAPIVSGVPALVDALESVVATTPAAVDRGRPRLWVDRSFPVPGAGTVVTGTLTGGSLSVGDTVSVLPGGLTSRVRQLHSHHVALDRASPGRRLAINLPDIAFDAIDRGQAVVRADQWHQTRRVDASLTLLPSVDHPVSRRGAYKAYIGSGEHPVRVHLFGPHIRIWLPVALPLQPGDRYVLRESGRDETIGGGMVLDVDPVRRVSRAAPSISVSRVVAERGWVPAVELGRLVGATAPPEPTVGGWVVDPSVLASTRAALLAAVEAAGDAGLDMAKLPPRERSLMSSLDVAVRDGRAFVAAPAGLSGEASALLAELTAGGYAPPAVGPAAALRELQRAGLAVESEGTWFAAVVIEQAIRTVGALLAASPAGITVGDVRDALGSSRKHVIPLLGHLDATGVTRRRGDLRIAGPRLAHRD